MAAKFEVRQTDTKQFQWVLLSRGRVLATSEPYSRKASCLKAIDSFRTGAGTAPVVEGNTTKKATATPAADPDLAGRAAAAAEQAIPQTVATIEPAPSTTRRSRRGEPNSPGTPA